MRITDFPELVTATGNDLLVTVDIANDVTKKIKLENLPTSIATTVALATKQNLLVSGTNIKTVNSTSLLGSGDIALQPTLVSGTNIKTLNSVSLLGSGDIVLTANPSGVAGAIQFSNGSAFASDATNLFWDDTNNRLGIGTNAPSATGHFQGAGDQLWATNSGDIYTYLKLSANGGLVSMTFGDGNGTVNYLNNYAAGMWASNKFAFGPSLFTPSGQVHIKGSGSTSATTSLLVQNSAGTAALTVKDDLNVTFGSNANLGLGNVLSWGGGAQWIGNDGSGGMVIRNNNSANNTQIQNGGLTIGTANASAILQAESTTKGFLPPRMTTTQKNAIASPAAGLQVYDTTTNKLQCYNGSTWNDLF